MIISCLGVWDIFNCGTAMPAVCEFGFADTDLTTESDQGQPLTSVVTTRAAVGPSAPPTVVNISPGVASTPVTTGKVTTDTVTAGTVTTHSTTTDVHVTRPVGTYHGKCGENVHRSR